MKYIIYWVGYAMVVTYCSDKECSFAHWQKAAIKYQKTFENKKEAYWFYDSLINSQRYWERNNTGRDTLYKADSIKIVTVKL